MQETTAKPGAFGEVLEEIMRLRNIEPTPENIRDLAQRSGLDPDGLVRNMLATKPDDAEGLGDISGLVRELSLTGGEMNVLAEAYAFFKGSAQDVRRLRICHAGSRSPHPCWQPATHRMFWDDPMPTLCGPHKRVTELAERADRLREDLDTMQGWIEQLIAPELRGEARDRAQLERRLYTAHDEMLEEYLTLSVSARAAQAIANQGEGEEPLSWEEAERRARRFILGDAYLNTAMILEDCPHEMFSGKGSDKWLLVAAANEAAGTTRSGETEGGDEGGQS